MHEIRLIFLSLVEGGFLMIRGSKKTSAASPSPLTKRYPPPQVVEISRDCLQIRCHGFNFNCSFASTLSPIVRYDTSLILISCPICLQILNPNGLSTVTSKTMSQQPPQDISR